MQAESEQTTKIKIRLVVSPYKNLTSRERPAFNLTGGNMSAEVTKTSLFNMQVCIPENWEDDEAMNFANKENPSGLDKGWYIQKQGHEALNGDNERVPCSDRSGFVHIMLEC